MDALTRIIDAAVQAKDYTTLATVFSDHAGSEHSWQSVGQGEQRSLAAHFIHAAVTSSTTNNANGFLDAALNNNSAPHQSMIMMQVFVRALSHLPATVPLGADNTLRQYIFDWMLSRDDPDYAEAARILSGMRMDSNQDNNNNNNNANNNNNPYYKTAAEITNVHVQIAECFLACDEEMLSEADAAVTRAGNAVQGISQVDMATKHVSLILRYKTTCARVLDANRKFLQAAQRYHELSTWNATSGGGGGGGGVQVDPDDLLALLGRAATCAILAPPTSGPLRARVLQHIYMDQRLLQLNGIQGFETHASILKKMACRQILRPHELKQFEASLAEHQKAIMGDGLTIMERGVVEHNMIAVSNLYSSIHISELAYILGVSPLRAEKIATSMIMDGTIAGCLDQVQGLLEFENDALEESGQQQQHQAAAEAWDRSITGFCLELNRVTDSIKAWNQAANKR